MADSNTKKRLSDHDRLIAMDTATEAEKGHSLLADAWKRLKNNKVSMISMWLLVVISIAGYSAPLISEHLTYFSLDEGHNRYANHPPGTEDVSEDRPTFDGVKETFAIADLNGDGAIKCSRRRIRRFTLPALKQLDLMTRPAATRDNPNPPPSKLYLETEASVEELSKTYPLKEVVKLVNGSYECPELQELHKQHRFYKFLFSNYDRAAGNDAPGKVKQPDGFITWKEFPKHDGEVKAKYRNRGLTGPDAFRNLDIDGDNVLQSWEVGERSRYMYWTSTYIEALLEKHDKNGDLVITRDEYPGAPKARVFWLGTDSQGRDVLTRLFYGARISITIALLTTLVAFLIGVAYGSIAGYMGGRVDNIMMRIVDVLYGLPYLIVIILLIVILGRSTTNLFIALGAFWWLNMARIVRGQVISLKTREFVEAARAIGVGRLKIIFGHLLRNCVGPIIVYSTLLVPGVILAEAFLSFLGLGVQPPDPSWGNMITEGASKVEEYPWLIIYPGLSLAVTLFAMNFLGDGVRDAIDPKAQKG